MTIDETDNTPGGDDRDDGPCACPNDGTPPADEKRPDSDGSVSFVNRQCEGGGGGKPPGAGEVPSMPPDNDVADSHDMFPQ